MEPESSAETWIFLTAVRNVKLQPALRKERNAVMGYKWAEIPVS